MNMARSRPALETLATGAGLVIMIAISLVMDTVSGGDSVPDSDATTEEIVAFLEGNRTGLQWDLAGRFFILFVLFLPIAFGLSRHVRGQGDRAGLFSQLVPFLAVWLMAVGAIANTVQGIAVFESGRLLDEPAVARTLFLAITALFLLTMLPHGAIIGAVSEAGRRSGALPLWLSVLGYLVSLSCLGAVLTLPFSAGFPDGSLPGIAAGIAYTTIGPWYLIAGIVLVVKGWRLHRVESPVAATV